MSRPKPTLLHTIEADDGTTWDIIQAPANYVITYQGQPCGVRHHIHTLVNTGFRYQKLSYTGLGNAEAQARRLNYKFKTEDFAVLKL